MKYIYCFLPIVNSSSYSVCHARKPTNQNGKHVTTWHPIAGSKHTNAEWEIQTGKSKVWISVSFRSGHHSSPQNPLLLIMLLCLSHSCWWKWKSPHIVVPMTQRRSSPHALTHAHTTLLLASHPCWHHGLLFVLGESISTSTHKREERQQQTQHCGTNRYSLNTDESRRERLFCT